MRVTGPRQWLFGAFMALAACAPVQGPTIGLDITGRAATNALPDRLPAMKTFGPAPAPRATRSNTDIARDFMDLSFRMESGRTLDILTRFEGPISLRVVGQAPVSLAPDLGSLLQRLRLEAGLNITVTTDESANINLVPLPKKEMQRIVPNAACFVVPNVRDWADFKRARRGPRVDWVRLSRREQVAIFLPSDSAPQELRDCLHEEIAQALGPLNDLYRLPDSVFNDDNIHTVLTGFDMLILKAYYAPELSNGMSREDVAARLPAILSRLNPAGNNTVVDLTPRTQRDWIDEMAKALGSARAPLGRRQAAENAINMGTARGWQDARLGFSHYALGRLTIASNPDAAQNAFLSADRVYASQPEMQLHRAYVAVQLAAFALLEGDAQTVLRVTEPHITTARRHENAALL
ncbi:MAG: DUF2927 domain-containing protein, partial [Pseudomonadota bacterium]